MLQYVKSPSSPRRACITLAHTPLARIHPPRARSARSPRLCIHPSIISTRRVRRSKKHTYRDEAHRFATRGGVFVFTRRAHRDARALSASRARGDDGRRDDGRRENAGHHHHRRRRGGKCRGTRGRRAPRGGAWGGRSRVMTRRLRYHRHRVWVWFFCGHYIPCIFRVYSRVSSSSDVFEYDVRGPSRARDRIARSRS